ncbi:SDR family NAD(P)-dependent oxidoreductase [Novosphingobium kaempferiae]|uniref:SDR family NAD(P)-dependent oxidoreductase n=1 Tax=Novosphingobium kaempferiae TaxID=2896849 RepID=UPI001E575B41|nr:SDR family oxidoreductase [Novosphingobium kaempferiae]
MSRLSGQVAIITGGNSGIGFATAQIYVENGARVVIVGRREDAVAEAVARLGSSAVGLIGNVADLATHDRVTALVAERFGRADIYVANAGGIRIQSSVDVTPADFDMQFLANTRGTFFGVQKMLPLMNDGGSIILMSSIATHKVLDGHAVYAGSKAAIEAFARNWALELKERCIRVNVLSPGPTDTPILGKLGLPAEIAPQIEEQSAGMIPFGRMGQADDLARAALFLASSDSSFVTGVNLAVDGGLTLA